MKAFWKLMSYLKPYWLWALLAPLFMALEVGLDLVQPRLIATIVDEGVALRDMNVVLNTGLWMIGLALAAGVAGVTCSVFAVLASEGLGADMRASLFRKIHSLSFANVDKLETGSLVTRVTDDISQVQNATAMLLRMMVRGPLMLVGSLIMAAITGPELAPLFFVLIPLIVLTIALIVRRAFPLFKLVQGKVDQLNTVMQESLMGVRVVKAFVRGSHEEKRFDAANDELMALSVKAMRTVSIGWPIMMLILQVGVAAVLWFGGVRVVGGTMQVGEVIAFINYLMRTLMSLMMVSMIVIFISRAGASAQRIDEVLVSESAIQNRPDARREFPVPATAGLAAGSAGLAAGSAGLAAGNNGPLGLAASSGVRYATADPGNGRGNGAHHASASNLAPGRPLGRVAFENVTFAYDGEEREAVLQNVSFLAEPGQTVAILGATGAGKSSLIHLIPRFYDVQGGRVTIDGVDVREMHTDALRRNVAVALQEPLLFTGSIRDNIRYGRPHATDAEVESAARMAQAHDFILSFPDGYDTELGQRGVNLSGGQKQRIAIARALLVDPAVLILDDSTSSVDVETEGEIQEALAEFVKGLEAQPRTTFIVAQRISTVLNADKILVLEGGEIAAEGTHAELMVSSPIYRDIYDSQLGEGVLSND
jgi:ATP-binding cassette, subfamily B, multidrug efflux pump